MAGNTEWEDYSEHVARLESVYGESESKKKLLITTTTVAVIIAAVVSLALGSVQIPISDVLKSLGHALFPVWIDGPDKSWYSTIVINGRLPRIVLCILCGFSLAVSGAVMQNILRNPLVSPFTLGVSSAASFGAAMGIVFFSGVTGYVVILGHYFYFESLLLVTLAFASAMLSIGFVIALSRRRNISRSTIILAGVIISYLFQAGVSLAKYFSNDEALRDITLWLMGGMWNATWGIDYILIPVVIVSFVFIELLSAKINVLSAGDEVAMNLGINVGKLRSTSLLLCTLMTSVCISFTGIIGFIGLIAPHVCRMFIGNDSRYLIPAAGVVGALILLVSDTIARIIISPEELPVGIIMYILGGIFFIWLITNKQKEVTF